MKITELPVQFQFASQWLSEIVPQRKKPEFERAFQLIQYRYIEIAEFKCEEAREYDEELAEMNLKLDLMTALVRCYDLHWIDQTFEELDVADFSLALAEALFPEQEWLILSDGDEFEIVTNSDRTMVFDLKNHRKISAAASLVLANDPDFEAPASAIEEANWYRKQRYNRELQVLQKLEQDLAPARMLSLVPNPAEETH